MSITAQIAISALRTVKAGAKDGVALLFSFALILTFIGAAQAQETPERRAFRIKYIAEGVVYIDGGSAAGLKLGEQLVVDRPTTGTLPDTHESVPAVSSGPIATLAVLSLAASSAVCEIKD